MKTEVTDIQAKVVCKQFTKLIRRNYKQLKACRFRKSENSYQFRARFNKRQLFAWGLNPEYAMSRFMLEIYRKVFYEKYYPTEEFKKIKDQLQRKVLMSYPAYELPEESK
jgi:hypothetical protein